MLEKRKSYSACQCTLIEWDMVPLQYKLCSWQQMRCDCILVSCVLRWLVVTCRLSFVSFEMSIVSFAVNWLPVSQFSEPGEVSVILAMRRLQDFGRPLWHWWQAHGYTQARPVLFKCQSFNLIHWIALYLNYLWLQIMTIWQLPWSN